MSTQRIIVTGGSGKAGHWIVKHLIESGYDVINVDHRRPAVALCRTIIADLTQLGQVVSAFSPHATGNRAPYAGVIHMAVVASSESSYGICFADKFFEPRYLPIDEAHPQLPEDTYGLTKVVNEVTAAMFHRRDGTQILSFRIGNVVCPEDYAGLKARLDHPEDRLRILWSYIDSRDLAIACRLAIEKDGLGCEPVIVAADDTSSHLPTAELIKRYLPGMKDLKQPLPGRQSLISNARLKALLGWEQQHFYPF